MSYKKMTLLKPVIDSAFVEAIAQELRLAQSEGSPDAPLIIEEEARHSGRIHVTVIWDRWGQVGPEERSRMILEAYEQVRGPGTFLTLTSALGLTHAEAKRLSVENGVLSAA
jgi:hypothetical protein